jgi:hypothetical protein
MGFPFRSRWFYRSDFYIFLSSSRPVGFFIIILYRHWFLSSRFHVCWGILLFFDFFLLLFWHNRQINHIHVLLFL